MAREFVEGREVPEIAARYGVAEDYVDRVIEQASAPAKPRRAAGLAHWGNRLVLALFVGWLAWLATGRDKISVLFLVAVGFFALVTAILGRKRD